MNLNSENSKQSQTFRTDGGKTKSNAIEIPSISLPKGGGAIKGIDETFSVNAVNGSAAFSIPLPFSPARGAAPTISLSYNSGSGNGIFGLGWNLGLASIKRKTDKILPLYNDENDSDTFLFFDAEDLVPEFKKTNDGSFQKSGNGEYIINEKDSPDANYKIRFYKPRIEGLFARIERWKHKSSGEIRWRIISRDNITTLFGWSAGSRIADPNNENRIFEWLPEFMFDDQGNCAQYVYKPDDNKGLDNGLLHNRNRFKNGTIGWSNLYPEKILYGNKTPYKKFGDAFPAEGDFLFSTVFDYGEYNLNSPFEMNGDWNFRSDAFSNYRAGFEIRTTRLCRRILQFHHFKGDNEYDGLVKSLNIGFDTSQEEFIFLKSVTSFGYIKKADGSYSVKQFPSLEFEYQKQEWNSEIKTINGEDLANVPAGLEESNYQFTDLYNEGLSGILTEQGSAWYYKSNLGNGEFAHAKQVLEKPSFLGLGSSLQLADLDADGGRQLVSYHSNSPGFFELDDENKWRTFKPFKNIPNIDFQDPDSRMIDLNGDGIPEIIISEDNAISFFPSNGREGLSEKQKSVISFDEEEGPKIVFSDSVQTIFLADMSGDGLTDLVRIRNSEVCYWPNLGFGKFGNKVTFDNSPHFDYPDFFNPAYIRLADIDGSGTTDVIYLGKNKFSCWKNQSGNSFSVSFEIEPFNEIHSKAKVFVTDLLGTGVACIVWSSSLEKNTSAPLKYIDLTNSRKPHVLIGYKNNLGKEVSLEYQPSTRFYLDDKKAGKPWITKLHFPVQCVSKTITEDKITGYKFVCGYNYHHGYYDHAEREFRGFGMVEQTDAETFDHWKKGNASNIVEEPLHQEPVVTKIWYHTGAFLGKDKIYEGYKNDFWYNQLKRNGFETVHFEKELTDVKFKVANGLDESVLENLSGVEWQEAFRACKGLGLRSEVFAYDAVKKGNTDEARKKELTPFTVGSHNCIVQLIQPKGQNKHAVFSVTKSESYSCNYERNSEDPGIAHSLNIKTDEYGNVLESAAIVYPRKTTDLTLPVETRQEQGKTVIIYKKNQYTNDVGSEDLYRLRLPSEVETFELRGVSKAGIYYELTDFDQILSDAKSDTAFYHETEKTISPGKARRRLIEHIKTLYYKNDLTGSLSLHQLESLAMPFENYQLAFTSELITHIFGTRMNDAVAAEGGFVHLDGDNNWWIRSGISNFTDGAETLTDAQNRFYLPVSFTDPFGAVTKVSYYGNYFLNPVETTDALGNKATVENFNFRTLAPQRIKDINGNFSEVINDELGLVKATAVYGKGLEADELTSLTEFTDAAEELAIQDFFNSTDSVQLTTNGKALLQRATIRFVYNLETDIANGKPAVAASISREEHFQKNANSPIQLSFEYSGGMGEVVMKKIQAEPGKAKQVVINPDDSVTVSEVDTSAANPIQLRWIGNGKTILNNKGNPVKQYEPYFSVTHQYENLKELVESGVTSVMYYDAIGRLVKTILPDGTLSKVEFNSWNQTIFDTCDTIPDPECSWFINRTNRLIDAELTAAGKDPLKEKQAADKAAKFANTSNIAHFDVFGRPVLSVEHNKNLQTGADEFYFTRVKTDVEGNMLSTTDARGNTVVQYQYDMLGNMVWQNATDSGQRWIFINIAGNPIRSWDERNHEFQYFFDILQRPTHSKVIGGDGTTPLDNIYGRIIYGESLLSPDRDNEAAIQAKNVLGQPIQQYDTAGLLDTQEYDFKGKPISVTRKLFKNYRETADWTDANLAADLETEAFVFVTETDALGRITRQVTPDGSELTPVYNEAGLLNSESVKHPGSANPEIYIKNIDYNERGQREKVVYGNDVTTQFYFDKETFRLNRLETRRQNNDPLQDWNYTYDPAGNITHIEDKNVPVVFFNNQKVTGVSEYSYNALYQLVEATGRENNAALSFGNQDNWNDTPFVHQLNPGDPLATRNYTQQYQYDEVGNITRMKHVAAGNNWTRNYIYNVNSNRLLSTSIGDNGNPQNYTNYQYHPQHGFITALPHLDEMSWSFKEELVKCIRQKVNPGNGTPETTWFQYDGQGQRIRKITENSAAQGAIPTVKEERIYLEGYERYKKLSATNTGLERISLSITDAGHRFVIIETRNDVNDGTEKQLVRYQLNNHVGSASLEVDDTASIISYEEYHPFGTTAYQAVNSAIKSAAKRYRFTGMERDEETGLEYHNARYYMPWLGRWLSCDPIGIGDGVNVYCYARGNPVSFSDSSGMNADEEMPSQILDLESMVGIPDSSSSGNSSGIFDEILSAVSDAFTAIGEAIVAAGRWIAETAAKFWDWIKETAVAAWDWIKQAATDAWNWIKGALETAWDWTKNAVVTAWNWTIQALSDAWEWIKNAASAAWEWIKQAAADTWNYVLAPLIRTATNTLGGFFIGFLSGGLTGGIIGASAGFITGAVHGFTMADVHSYDWNSVSGWVGFLADNTWGLPNSMVGSLFATANIIGGNPIDRANSRNSGALMFENEWFDGYATTLGNVIVGTKGLHHDVLEHELAHVLQARIFGPIFYPTMIAHYVINTIFPYWLLYHNKRYPNTPIRNFGEYFSRGVYPHTWAEEWGYSVGGHPN